MSQNQQTVQVPADLMQATYNYLLEGKCRDTIDLVIAWKNWFSPPQEPEAKVEESQTEVAE